MFSRIKKYGVSIGLLLCAVFLGYSSKPSYFEGQSQTHSALQQSLKTELHKGISYFAFGDWGSLTSDALRVSASPWKLSLAALALQQTDGNLDNLAQFDVAATFRQFGFLSPTTIGIDKNR